MNIYIKKTLSSSFEAIETLDKELGKGGQARVFKIQTRGYEDFCLKKYIREEEAQKNYDRISYMIQNPPQNFMGNSSFRICWPTAFAYDSQKKFIGYIMPLAFPNSRDLKILEVYNAKPISQQAKYSKYPNWFDKYELDTDKGLKNRMKMLCNWAIAIYSLHKTHKYVIVDLKPENVMATDSGKISIVDTDSFQISENGKILFPGVAYTPAYFPPEGRILKQQNAPFPITCDCFAAAVCFYKILTGVHPFSGTIKKTPYDKLETEEEFINAGLFAYGDKMCFLDFNPNFNLHKHFENLSPNIQNLFKRAFGTNANARPTMDEWGKILHEVAMSNVNLIHATIKPPKTNSLSIQIQYVRFRDTDYDGNVIRDYGDTLYTDVTYLSPQIAYKILKAGRAVELSYKIYTPSGILMSGATSKPGFTNSVSIHCPAICDFVLDLPGWGNNDKSAYAEPGTWRVEFYEGDKCLYKTSVKINALKVNIPNIPPQTSYTPPKKSTIPPPLPQKNSKSKGCLWLVLLIGILGAGYQFWYKDYKRDKDAPRNYVYATNLFLRSSAVADVEYNRISTVPYGSELITYSNVNGWAYVKADGKKGYVASDYLLNAKDFHLLNGVWGNDDAKEIVPTAKCRMAILDFLKKNNMQTGNMAWQLYSKQKEIKPNSVLFPRLNDGYDNFTEFAFILKDNQSGNRKLALYSFEENERPVFRYMEDAPEKGDIKSINYNRWKNKYKISYTSYKNNYVPQTKKEIQKEKQLTTTTPISILSVMFGNTDFNNNVLTEYGEQLYTDIQYLSPIVAYKKESDNAEMIKLGVRILNPKGELMRGNTSPISYTFENEITLLGKEGNFILSGWGNNNRNLFAAGIYHYEIWYNGKKLYSVALNIADKSIAKSEISDTQVYESVDEMPEFPDDGMTGLMKYLSKNIKYPTIAQENGIQGRVTVQFIVNKDGGIESAKVLKSIDPHLDREALRVVMGMPKWKPGKKDGKIVRVRYTVPISFRLR